MATLLTVPEVAERLRVSRWAVYDLVHAGQLPVVRLLPHKMLFNEQDIDTAIRRATERRSPRR